MTDPAVIYHLKEISQGLKELKRATDVQTVAILASTDDAAPMQWLLEGTEMNLGDIRANLRAALKIR